MFDLREIIYWPVFKNVKVFCIIAMLSSSSLAAGQKVTSDPFFNELQTKKIKSDSLIQWQQFGPGNSGYCEIVEYHPTDPNCIMMSPDMYNTYGSWDNGATWKSVKDTDGDGGDMKRMRDYAFSIQNPDFGVALDVTGLLWMTYDRGRTWSNSGSFDKGKCAVVEMDPTNDSILYIGGGDFWNVKKNKRTYERPHNVVMEGTEYGKIWRSNDRGKSWSLQNKGIPYNADIGKIWIHPANPEAVYAATSYGLYKSINHGLRWHNIGTELPHNMIRDMACLYDSISNTTTICVIDQVFWEPDGKGCITSTGGVYRTIDDGINWTDLNNNLYLDFTSVSSFVTEFYYKKLGAWFGIDETTAKIRYPKLPTALLQMFNRLLVDPSNTSRIYLGHSLRHDISIYPGDLWMSEDAGESWISIARIGKNWQGADRSFWEKRGNPVIQNMHFAHLAYLVEDEPYPWTGCRALSVNSLGDVTGVFEQQTFQSRDHGDNWYQVDDIETTPGSEIWVGTGSSNLPGRQIIMDLRMPGRYLFLSGEHGIWKLSNDVDKVYPGAAAVHQIEGQINGPSSAFSIADAAIHPRDTNIIYALMFRQNYAGQVRMTTNGGESWENITIPGEPVLTPDGTIPDTDWNRRAHQYSLIINEVNPQNIYFCLPSWVLNDVGDHRGYITTQFGVHRSTDGGYHWTRQNTGILADPTDGEDLAVNDLCFDPSDKKTLYAAVMQSFHGNQAGGLYVSSDSADTWEKMDLPAEIRSVNHVHIDSITGKIYIACGHKNGGISNGGVWVSDKTRGRWKKIFEMPLVFKVATAPYDSSRIAVTVGPGNIINGINPGVYISLDNGSTWSKSNIGLGQPDRIKDLHFDLQDRSLMWCSLWGSGFYKGFFKNRVIARAENTEVFEGEHVLLDGSASLGGSLKYTWIPPENLSIDNVNLPQVEFTAPEVLKDSVIQFQLHVENGVYRDSVFVNVFVRRRKITARNSISDNLSGAGCH